MTPAADLSPAVFMATPVPRDRPSTTISLLACAESQSNAAMPSVSSPRSLGEPVDPG